MKIGNQIYVFSTVLVRKSEPFLNYPAPNIYTQILI